MSKFAEFAPRPPDRRPDRPPLRDLGAAIRAATVADAAALASIAHERDGGDLDRLRRHLDEVIAAGREPVHVAEHEREIVGFARAGFLRHQEPRPTGCVPDGWYLTGVNVRPAFRRRGVGHDLTRSRLAWLSPRTDRVHYFAAAVNRVSIALHEGFGFVELARGVAAPGVTFTGGVGVLFALDLRVTPAG